MDFDPLLSEPNESETHRHSMIVVRFYVGPHQSTWMDRQPVFTLINIDTEFAQFDRQISNSIGFFDAVVCDVSDRRGTLNKDSNRRKRLDRITDIGHVDVDAVFGRSSYGDFIISPIDDAAHLFQAIHKTDVTLNRILIQTSYRRRPATNRCHRPKIACCRRVGFNLVFGPKVSLSSRNPESVKRLTELTFNTKRLHDLRGHLNVRFRNQGSLDFDDNVLGCQRGSQHQAAEILT